MNKTPEPKAHAGLAIADLIQQHCQRTGDSYSDLARASGLSKARIGQLALTGTPAMPRHETLVKLSKALKLPLAVIQSAAMVSAGVSPDSESPDQRIALLVAHIADLPEVDLEYVETFVSALVARTHHV